MSWLSRPKRNWPPRYSRNCMCCTRDVSKIPSNAALPNIVTNQANVTKDTIKKARAPVAAAHESHAPAQTMNENIRTREKLETLVGND